MASQDNLIHFHFSRQMLIVKHDMGHCHLGMQMENFQNVLQWLAINFDKEFQCIYFSEFMFLDFGPSVPTTPNIALILTLQPCLSNRLWSVCFILSSPYIQSVFIWYNYLSFDRKNYFSLITDNFIVFHILTPLNTAFSIAFWHSEGLSYFLSVDSIRTESPIYFSQANKF